MRSLARLGLLLACFAGWLAAKDLQVYFIDVEGGQSTLFVAPSGESLLMDVGWGGFNHRDGNRIAAAAKAAGVKKIDYLVISHYHADHAGGILDVAGKFPIRNFVDHGDTTETGQDAKVLFNEYTSARAKGNHVLVRPGDVIPIKGLEVHVLAAGGETLAAPLTGAGEANPSCATYQAKDEPATENQRSIGLLISYGNFRILDLGDLTTSREHDLVCPANKIGTVDVFVSSHHMGETANTPQLLQAIRPKVAIGNNGARKGGEAWETIHGTPGLMDIWQLHYALANGKDHNSPDTFIANVDEACQGKWLRLTVEKDGSYTIFNSRNRYEKTYSR